jgi:hypothetical protein
MWCFESMNRTSLRSIAAIHGIPSAPPAAWEAHVGQERMTFDVA